MKETGAKHFNAERFQEAHTVWFKAHMKMRNRMTRGASWYLLYSQGGHKFIVSVAEFCFDISLMAAQAGLQILGTELTDQAQRGAMLTYVNVSLQAAQGGIVLSYWAPDFKWMPQNSQLAKLPYLIAKCVRLGGVEEGRPVAISLIADAMALSPDDADIKAESRAIVGWTAEESEQGAQP